MRVKKILKAFKGSRLNGSGSGSGSGSGVQGSRLH
jgi:hypothetical protein